MKKSLFPVIKVFGTLCAAAALMFALSSCQEEEEPSATAAPSTPTPVQSTFKPVVDIIYDENEFQIVDTTIVEYIGDGGDVKIPEKVTAIGDMAFSGRSDVTSVEFTKDVVSIGEKAFENCTGLTGVFTPPSNLAYIGDSAFAGCTGITEVELQNKPMTVGTHIFEGCTSLQKVIIPKTMGTITIVRQSETMHSTAVQASPRSSSPRKRHRSAIMRLRTVPLFPISRLKEPSKASVI